MFFEASKLLWAIIVPANLLLFALVVDALLLWTRRARAGRLLIGATAIFAVFVSVVPAGQWMVGALENRFPVPAVLPDHVDGIVVLGGGTTGRTGVPCCRAGPTPLPGAGRLYRGLR